MNHFTILKLQPRLIEGVGIYDYSKPTRVSFNVDGKEVGRNNPAFGMWKGMLTRCYSDNHQNRCPTYVGTKVCEEWLTFSNFYSWWSDNYVEGWHLDKDILTNNREYSPENCVYVPSKLNAFTLDCGRSRGKYLIGVTYSKKNCKFQSRCRREDGVLLHLGMFDDEMQAHLAWRDFKLNLALERKADMDEIDTRIYPRIVEIINNLK